MHNILTKLAVAAGMSCLMTAQVMAADVVSETRAIDARIVRIALDGFVTLKVRQGATPSLTVTGEREILSKITTSQSGDTLRVGADLHDFRSTGRGRTHMGVEVTLPALAELSSSGIGASEISGFGGDALKVSLSGAGQMKVSGTYKRVNASLSGVGQLTLDARDADSIELSLPGAGSVIASGQTKALSAMLSGVGNLRANDMPATTANVVLSGLGNATVNVSREINLTMSGLGSATVFGQPTQRNANTSGMGRVIYK